MTSRGFQPKDPDYEARVRASFDRQRVMAEMDRGVAYHEARAMSLQAAMIPVTNSLFAAGIVTLPGMMTGQILSGVDPLIAARYQIVVMCMVFASAGLSAAVFLVISKAFLQGRVGDNSA